MDMAFDLIDEPRRRRFESAWRGGEPVTIDSCLPEPHAESYLPTLEELVHIELEMAWKRWAEQSSAGESPALPPSVTWYQQRFPALRNPEIQERLLDQERAMRARFQRQRKAAAAEPIGDQAETRAAFSNATQPTLTGSGGEGTVERFAGYEILGQLGQGGMGTVYHARQVGADREVALKVIRRDWLKGLSEESRQEALDRFATEARAAAGLDHAHLVRVYEVGEAEGLPYYSMQFVRGCSLADLLRDGPLTPRETAAGLADIADAVAAAHAQGIVHRDLKPQNILADDGSGRWLATDFGLAKRIDVPEGLTATGDVLGTPAYMAPEQARGEGEIGPATDIYALGATFYHALAGRPPLQASTAVETLRQVLDVEPVSPERINPAVDLDAATICLKCLEKSPAARYGSAAELAADLRRYVRGEPIAARPVPWWEHGRRWAARHPLPASLLGIAVLLLLAMGVSIGVGYRATYVQWLISEQHATDSRRHYGWARDAVDELLVEVSENELLGQPAMFPARERLLRQALAFYEKFAAESARPEEAPAALASEARAELADTHYKIAKIQALLGDADEAALAAAATAYGEAVQLNRQILRARSEARDRQIALAQAVNGLGVVQIKQGSYAAAEQSLQQALLLRDRLHKSANAADRSERIRELANTSMNLGLLAARRKEWDEAWRQQRAGQKLRREVPADSRDAQLLSDLAKAEFNLAKLAAFSPAENLPAESPAPRVQQIEDHLRSAALGFRELVRQEVRPIDHGRQLLECQRFLAQLLLGRGQDDRAEAVLRELVADATRLGNENPAYTAFQRVWANALLDLSELALRHEAPAAAEQDAQRAFQVLFPLARTDSSAARDAAVAQWRRATALLALDRRDEARQQWESAVELITAAAARNSRFAVDRQRIESDRALRDLP